MKKLTLLLSAFVLLQSLYAAPGQANEVTVKLAATEVKSGKNVWVGVRTIKEVGDETVIETRYNRPDGQLIHEDKTVYKTTSLAPVFYTITDHRMGRKGELRLVNGKLEMSYQENREEKVKRGQVAGNSSQIVSLALDKFIRNNLPSLMAGKEVDFEYPSLERTDTYQFRLQLENQTTQKGQTIVMVRLEPNSWVIRKLVDPMYYTLAVEGEGLIGYEGRTMIPDDKGNPQIVRIKYSATK